MILASISLYCLALAQDAIGPFPHPSKPAHSQTYDQFFKMGNWMGSETPNQFWERLSPSWFQDEESNQELQGLEALSRHLAETHSWSEGSREAWKSIATSAPITASCSIVDGEGSVLLSGESPIFSGIPIRFGRIVAEAKVGDFDVEVAQRASIADPSVDYLVRGRSLSLRAFSIVDSGWQVEVAYVDTQPSPVEIIALGASCMTGGIERLSREVTEYGSTFFLKPGVKEILSLPSQNGETLFLHLQLNGPVPSIGQTQNGTRFLGVPNLASLDSYPAFIGKLREQSSVWSHESGWLAFEGEHAEQLAIGAAAEAFASAPTQKYRIQMRVFEAGELTGGQTFEAFLAPELPLQFAHGVAAQAVSDWDVEIASNARIPDPILTPLFAGFLGSITMQKDRKLAVDCGVSEFSFPESVSMLLADDVPASTEHDGETSSQPPIRVSVENPAQGSVGFRGLYPLNSESHLFLSQAWREEADSNMHTLELEIRRIS